MKVRDVLIVGAGIAGCAAALALVKRGIAVTIITSAYDERVYYAPFIQHDQLEDGVRELQTLFQEDLSSSRAFDQLASQVKKSTDELLKSHYLIDRNGNIDIYRCLKEQLEQYEGVEWLPHHTLIELLTLDQHSLKRSDAFKKPTCLGGSFTTMTQIPSNGFSQKKLSSQREGQRPYTLIPHILTGHVDRDWLLLT